jgi:DamX protein
VSSEAWAAPAQFELDDTPALEEPEPVAPTPPSHSGWDDEMETPHYADVPLAAPAPAPPLEPEEPQWGFDEAQIETARRANEPVPPPKKPAAAKKPSTSGRFSALILTLVAIAVVGLGGFFAWQWWQRKNAPAPAPTPVVVKRPAKKPVVVVPPPVTVTTATTATTASVAPKPAPVPVPVVTTSSAPPHLERTTTGAATITNTNTTTDAARAKYDAMAAEAAANTNGAFSVQFELVCETASVTRAMRDGGASVWISATSYRGRPCYRVMWGRFATKQEAESAIASIPASLREGSKPTVVKIAR